MKNSNSINYLQGFLGVAISAIQQQNSKPEEPPYNDDIEFSPVVLTDDYAKKWNERNHDFFKIYKDGVPVSENLYRKGGIFNRKDLNQPYFQIIRYTEDLYDRKMFPKHTTEQLRHLKSTGVIINSKTGQEVYEFKNSLDHGHIFKNSILFSLSNKIFNIQTKEMLCESIYSTLESEEFIFVDNKWSKTNPGVWKINKLTAEVEIFKGK